jgi:hypothetical protein
MESQWRALERISFRAIRPQLAMFFKYIENLRDGKAAAPVTKPREREEDQISEIAKRAAAVMAARDVPKNVQPGKKPDESGSQVEDSPGRETNKKEEAGEKPGESETTETNKKEELGKQPPSSDSGAPRESRKAKG